ncbi:MAG: hypothetical protein JHD00_08765, partial [Akkermansiaceae bacterium]|nr:hypothetical protein [Akkermansiaceae bacterium]
MLESGAAVDEPWGNPLPGELGAPVIEAGKEIGRDLDGKVAILSVVNPRAIKAHGDSDLRRCKSDPADARLIAGYCR